MGPTNSSKSSAERKAEVLAMLRERKQKREAQEPLPQFSSVQNPQGGALYLGVLSILFLMLLVGGLFWVLSPSKESEEARMIRVAVEERAEGVAAAKAAEDKENGYHCISAWNGAHLQFRDAVKRLMRDPDSFEHLSTNVTPISDEGTHTIQMIYRARNGFGGMNTGIAYGIYQNDGCFPTVLSIE
jgi:hypothetical protein